MNVLFIVPYVPNLIRVRPYQLLRTLIQLGHKATLVTLWSSAHEYDDLQALADLPVEIRAQPLPRWRSVTNTLLAVPTRSPLQAAYCWQPALARDLQDLVASQDFDVVHVEHLRGARYGLWVQSLETRYGRQLPVVWDSVDSISHLFEQTAKHSRSRRGKLLTWLDLQRTQRYEGALVRAFDQVLVTSPTDCTALETLADRKATTDSTIPHAPIEVLPNGVDLDYFMPNQKDGHQREPATIVFSGKMSYHANVTASIYLVREIMPLLWVQRPDVRVLIVGKDPAPEVRALADGERVAVTGTVPDIRPYLQRATVAVAPVLYGAGVQNKVLEAMACGAAVVASPQACSALATQPGEDLLVAQDAAEFAVLIEQLLAQPMRRRMLEAAGRRFVENHHSWAAVGKSLEASYQATIQRKQNQEKNGGFL